MNEEQARSLRKLLALRTMGRLFAGDCVEWAVEALVDGLDTPSLRILAGLSKPLAGSEVEQYFEAALAELGCVVPESELTLRAYVEDVAARLIEGALAPEVGCHELYEAWKALEHPEDLLPWAYLDDGLDPGTYGPLSVPELHAAILREARRLSDGTGALPSSRRHEACVMRP